MTYRSTVETPVKKKHGRLQDSIPVFDDSKIPF